MAEKFNFIKSRLDALSFDLELGKTKNYFYDEKINGLVLELTPKNLKTFQVYKKINGKPVRVKLGRYPDMTIDQARRLAQGKLSEMAEGINPNQVKKTEKKNAITLQEVFNDYLKARKDLKPGTVYDYNRTIEYYFKDWKDKPLADITRDMVERKHSQIGETAKAPANKAMRVLRALFNFAAEKYEDDNGKPIFTDNPVKRLSGVGAWYRIDKRTRHVKEYELKPFFEAITALSPTDGEIWQQAKVFLLITLFTGCRREEGLSLKWSNVDFKLKTLTFDDTKNKQVHVLPLSDFLFELLTEHRKTTTSKSDYLLPTATYKNGKPRSKTGYISNPQRHIEKIIERTGIEFSDHDLRRTFATTADTLDFDLKRIKRLINHADNDVTLGYIMRNVERLRSPMQAITDYILKAAGVKQSAEIIPLEKVKNR